jgi:hypothetical protein
MLCFIDFRFQTPCFIGPNLFLSPENKIIPAAAIHVIYPDFGINSCGNSPGFIGQNPIYIKINTGVISLETIIVFQTK